MNEIGMILMGGLARGIVFAGLGLALCWALRRRGPAASATVALATLIGMAGMSALGASPWPRWWSLGDGVEGRATPVVVKSDTTAPAPAPSGPAATDVAAAVPRVDDRVGNALAELGRALMNPAGPVDRSHSSWGWPAWVAAIAIAGVVVGLGRFALGLVAVVLLRRGSRPVKDVEMLDLALTIRAELGMTREVAIRVAPGLTTPATVGWLRPSILLPEDWSGWDDRERRVVLAHELAHIHRNDYFSGLWAQFSLALHYYNPMAHWLSRRLRLDQELAADAWGAQLVGGNRPYLATLARLALRSDPRPVGWPARSFRPGRGTFLRRIEMLRDVNELHPSPLPRRARLVAIGGLVLAGLALAGLRGPGGFRVAEASPAPLGLVADNGFIPADAAAIAVLRPADLMTRPEIKQIVDSFEGVKEFTARFGLSPSDLEQVTIIWTYGGGAPEPPRGPMLPPPAGVVVRTVKSQDWKALATRIMPTVKEGKIGDVTVFETGGGPEAGYVAAPDDRTVVIAPEQMIRRMLAAKPGVVDRAPWGDAWNAVKKGQFAAALDMTWLQGRLNKLGGPPGGPSPLGAFSPLIDKAEAYAIGLDLSKAVTIDGVITCAGDGSSKAVGGTLRASILLGKNMLETMKTAPGAAPNTPQAALSKMIEMWSPLLDKATVTIEAKTVHLTSTADVQIAQVMAPAILAQRSAARRAQSVNNMKQIGLALHIYAQAHNNKFPPPVVLGPDGRTPHSWRVEILPYLEQQALFNEYKMDEPWDSPGNRKVLDAMPATFRSPEAKPGNASSYFVFTGKHTLFNGTVGTGFDQITDGTSNTIAAVEAVRDIPWTKPEDIPFDPADIFTNPNVRVPEIGGLSQGGFNALFGDGSVRFIKSTVNPMTLKALFTRDGGEVISSDSF
jgi:hypothetical protein